MSDWSSYELIHLIPFGKDVYLRLIARLNDGAYPQQFATLAIGLLACIAAWKRKVLITAVYLAPLYATTALIFFFRGYSELHWAGHYAGIFFLTQAGLLIWLAGRHRRTPSQVSPSGVVQTYAFVLMGLGLALWPLIGLALGGAPGMAECLGIHADPTALFGLGIAFRIFDGRRLLLAICVPLLWLTLSGLTHIALGLASGPALVSVAAASLFVALWQQRPNPVAL